MAAEGAALPQMGLLQQSAGPYRPEPSPWSAACRRASARCSAASARA